MPNPCVLTLGTYEFYWFYRNWRYIRDRDRVSIRPFWRAFFAPHHFRKLIADVDEHRDTASPIPGTQAGMLVVGYYVLTALWRLPTRSGWCLFFLDGDSTRGLKNAGLLQDNEGVLYFYSQGLLSMEEDGNMLTDTKVVSYWKDEETDELLVETARYEEIAAVETEYSYSSAEHTVITVQRTDGSNFILVVSPEDNQDVPFVDALESRIP